MRHPNHSDFLLMTWAAVGMTLLVSGCKVGPDYHPPAEQVPDQYDSSGSAANSTASEPSAVAPVDLAQWWKSFNDPVLTGFIEQAVHSNLDIAIASTRLEEARTGEQIAAAGLWPWLGFSSRFPQYHRASETLDRAHWKTRPRGSLYTRQSYDNTGATGPTSLYLTTPGNHPFQFLMTPGNNGGTTNVRSPLISPNAERKFVGRDELTYEAGFDAVWELDVFGGVRRSMEAAGADVQAEAEARNDVMVMLLADIARTYVQLRGLQQRLDIANQNIQGQQRTVTLVQTRFRNGLTSDLDVALAERQLEATQSRVPMIEAAIDDARHRLAFLLDQPVQEVDSALDSRAEWPALPPDVPTGLPSDLLRSRPDIREAERDLASETARIGVATSDLYPHFTLNGSIGAQTSDVRQMLNSDSLVWSAGPSMRWPIFNGGRIVANIEIHELRTQEHLLSYRRILLSALKEVNDALSAYTGERRQFLKLREAVESSNRAVRIANERYEKGLNDFLNVLDAERALYDLEDQAAVSEEEARVQLIALYKALGRGWEGVEQ